MKKISNDLVRVKDEVKAKASKYKSKAKKAGAAVGIGFAVLGLYIACKKQMDKELATSDMESKFDNVTADDE